MKQKGITLIALVITIIVLLILAGVTLKMTLSDNGIFSMAKKAKDSYEIASEREYLEQNVLSVQLEKYIGNVSSEKLGEILNTRNLENSSNWHIIKVNDKSYETGWNYIEKGTELQNYGKAENSWLVNYETGEIIELEEDKYISLSAGDMLAVKDSLIINVDSSIIDNNLKNDKETLEKQLGDGVTLENFDYNSESGLTSTSFNFDGVDDYIKVQYDKQEQKDALAKNGFTFEFYGIWNGGTTDARYPNNYKGLFCYWNGSENKQAEFRFGILDDKKIKWNSALTNADPKAQSDYSEFETSPWNIVYDISNEFHKGQVIYLTITLDTSNYYSVENSEEKYYKQKLYVNGTELYNGNYNKKQWDGFVNEDISNLKYFCIGRSSMNQNGWWHYSKMNAYCLRLYSRALSEGEVMKNYEKSVEYHSLPKSE